MPVPRLDSDVPMPRVPFREAKKQTPENTRNAALPFVLALGAGATTFIAVGMIAIGWKLEAKWPLSIAGGMMLAVMLVWLFWLMHDELLWTVETITGVDFDGDNVVGKPEPQDREPWRIIVENEEGGELWLNFDSEEMRQKAQITARLILHGTPFSEGALAGTGRPLSRAEFLTLRDLFMQRGLCEWKDRKHHTLGVRWTPPGRSFIRQLASGSTTPLRIRTLRGQLYDESEERGSVGLLEEGEE